MVNALLRRFTREPLARTTIALYELPMQYPSVRWQQTLPPRPPATLDAASTTTPAPDQPTANPVAAATPPARPTDPAIAAAYHARDIWLARTAILLIEEQVPLLTRELQGRVIGRLDEFVDYRVTWDKFAQQAPPREEGGLLLAELDARIIPGRPPGLRTTLHQHATARTAFSLLATILDGFAADSIRAMPPATQSWACLWLTYLIQWYHAAGPQNLRGRAANHPHFFLPNGTPDATDFPPPD